MSASTVLVTGGAGFIGSHLCERLLARGGRIVVIDNFDPFYPRAIKEGNLAAFKSHPHCTFVELDIRDREHLADLYARIQPQAVFHLAAKAGVRPSIADPQAYQDVNVRGTLNLLELAAKHKTPHFLFASSSSVYGNNPKVPFAETDNVDHPISPYAATKKACELLCYTFHHLYDLDVACLRFFTVYGPRQRPDLAIHKFARAILADAPITLFGDGTTSRDYTYIDDIINGVVACYEWRLRQREPSYDIFNLGNSHPTKLSELVRLLQDATQKTAIIEVAPMQDGDVERTFADVTHAHTCFGYEPKTAIRVGIERFVEWLRTSGHD